MQAKLFINCFRFSSSQLYSSVFSSVHRLGQIRFHMANCLGYILMFWIIRFPLFSLVTCIRNVLCSSYRNIINRASSWLFILFSIVLSVAICNLNTSLYLLRLVVIFGSCTDLVTTRLSRVSESGESTECGGHGRGTGLAFPEYPRCQWRIPQYSVLEPMATTSTSSSPSFDVDI